MKNTPNHRGDPMKNSKKILFQKSKCTHVSSINLKGKVSHSKNIVTAVVYFWEFPCGSPCTYRLQRYFLNNLFKTENTYIVVKNVQMVLQFFQNVWWISLCFDNGAWKMCPIWTENAILGKAHISNRLNGRDLCLNGC